MTARSARLAYCWSWAERPSLPATFSSTLIAAYTPAAHSIGLFEPTNDPQPIKIDVVQGGLTDDSKYLAPIAHEPTSRTGLRHRNGTISIARDGVGTGTAGAFFICIGDQPDLDFGGKRNPDGQGFAAFGQVTNGMALVRRMGAMKTQGPMGSSGGELIASPVRIVGARRA